MQNYEKHIRELEHQREESLNELDDMKQNVKVLTESMRNSQSSNHPCLKCQNLEFTESKLQKCQKELKRWKSDHSKLKNDFDSKLGGMKRKQKLEVEGYKAEIKLKTKEIERLKKEVEKFKRK